MVVDYFISSRKLYDIRLGPLGGLMDDFSEVLKASSYPVPTARVHLRNVAHFSRYLLWKGIKDVNSVTINDINDFLTNHLPNCVCYRSSSTDHVTIPASMKILHEFLFTKGIITAPVTEIDNNSVDGMIIRFQSYLKDITGASNKTISRYSQLARRTINARIQLHGAMDFEHFSEAEVVELHKAMCTLYNSADWKSTITSFLRMFMRFLYWEKITPLALARTLEPVRKWRLAEIPKALSVDELSKVLQVPDRKSMKGKRDYAILTLLATVGMRASEIVALKLDDIHWRKHVITVPGCKSRREHDMPLTDEAFDALVDYVKNARPQIQDRIVFLRDKAPVRGFANSGAITTIVTQAVIESGIQREQYRGPHALRHTLATLLINHGTPLKQISDMLGHKQTQTTEIYTKVDITNLRKLATPFPLCTWR